MAALSHEYGQKGVYLACENHTNQFDAVMPMFYTRGVPFGLGGHLASSRLSSLPRTPLGGPLSNNQGATVAILEAAVAEVAKDPTARLQIKMQRPELDGLVPGIVRTPWRSSYVLRRENDSGEPFRIHDRDERAKIRWAMNRADKLGVCVRAAETEEDLRKWYTLYLETMQRNAVPPRSLRFFTALWNHLRPSGMMELLLAELGDAREKRILAGSIFLKCNNTVSYAFNASSRKDFSLRANDVILWRSINSAFNEGVDFFDFGEVPEGHTKLAKFKSKWGANPVALYHYYYPALSNSDDASPPSSHYTRSFVTAVWRRLPAPLTAWLGDQIYSFL